MSAYLYALIAALIALALELLAVRALRRAPLRGETAPALATAETEA